MSKDYVIIAGNYERPSTALRGRLDKGAGQTIVFEQDRTLTASADIGFPNRTQAWGRRVIKGKDPKEVVDVKDPDYKGEIEFLKWGHPAGSKIICRYINGYNTLDQMYQDIVLNAADGLNDDNEATADRFFVRLQSGENLFDEDVDPMLVQYLKIHDYNEDSKSRNPNISITMFRQKKYEQIAEVLDRSIDAKFDSLKVVNHAGDDNSGTRLKNLFRIVQQITDGGELKDTELFSFLKKLADTKPDMFLHCINTWKREVSDTFEKAKIYQKLDLTKDGFIAAEEKNKFNVIAEGIDAKGEQMIEWCVTNFLDPIAFEAFFKLKKITDKLK